MAEPTPALDALSQQLQSSDEDLSAFIENPQPLLDKHGVTVSDDELTNLKGQLAKHDATSLKASLSAPMHAMFSQKA